MSGRMWLRGSLTILKILFSGGRHFALVWHLNRSLNNCNGKSLTSERETDSGLKDSALRVRTPYFERKS